MVEATHTTIVNEIYSTLSEIEHELVKRRKNKKLKKLVEDFLGTYLLEELRLKPRAVLSRTIINPNTEFRYFLDLAKELKLDPLGFEYHDKFVAKNPDKYHLAKLFFAKKRNDGTQFLSNIKIFYFNKYEGRDFKEIKTKNN